MTDVDYSNVTAAEIRQLCRGGTFDRPTAGVAKRYAQANLVALPGELAHEFAAFCRANPKPCPVLEVTSSGQYRTTLTAESADLRTDLPRYRVFRSGTCTDRPTDVTPCWRDDLVAFLIGCSFTFESALLDAGLPIRHIEQNRNVPMYRTGIECVPCGAFGGPLVVSMRPMTPAQAEAAQRVTAACPRVHGAPIHIGDPAAIGVRDLADPEYGDAVAMHDGEVPVFWACGVTAMEAVIRAKPAIAIVHEPGHMFVTDLLETDFREGATA